MRFVKSLLMLLMLVTFSTGFGKSTTDLKQNSKTEIVAFDIVKDVTFYSVDVETKIVTGLISTNVLSSESYCVTTNSAIDDVGWTSQLHYKKSNQLNFISCQELEQNSIANRYNPSNTIKWQILEPFTELQRKMLIFQNLHQTGKFQYLFVMILPHQKNLFQEKTTT